MRRKQALKSSFVFVLYAPKTGITSVSLKPYRDLIKLVSDNTSYARTLHRLELGSYEVYVVSHLVWLAEADTMRILSSVGKLLTEYEKRTEMSKIGQ